MIMSYLSGFRWCSSYRVLWVGIRGVGVVARNEDERYEEDGEGKGVIHRAVY